MTSSLKIIEAQQKRNITKLAITPPQHIAQPPKLHEWDVTQPLDSIIKDLAAHFNLPRPDEYGIQFCDDKSNFYITEETKGNVKNGIILKLATAPWKEAKEVFSALKSTSHRHDALQKLSVSSRDITFGAEFVKLHGVEFLIERVESGKDKGADLQFLLASILALMQNNLIASQILTPAFLKKIASYVSQSDAANLMVTETSLAILECVVMNCTDHYNTVANEVTLSYLCSHLDSQHAGIQQECLALINALCLKATQEKKKRFEESIASRELRIVLHEKVVRATSIGRVMSHNLYVFQQLCLNLLQHRRMTKVDPNKEQHQEWIVNLRRNAFAGDNEANRPFMNADDFKKLGFMHTSDPAKDFEATPPGVLALQCWSYLSNQHTESYTQMVHDNLSRSEEYQCQFAKACIALTESICNILHVGAEPDPSGVNYHPMFFALDDSFEEFFCHCIKLFHKTWKEMRASAVDFAKVMSVVEEQIQEALALKPSSLDSFWQQVQTRFAYTHIKELRKLRRLSLDDSNSKSQSVIDLKQQLHLEVMELIKQQRLNFMVKGSKLQKKKTKGPLYIRLSRNHKVLHYGNYRDSNSIPSMDSLKEKIRVEEIISLPTGKHLTTGRGGAAKNSFSVETQNNGKLDFSAETLEEMEMWIDGLNILLGKEPTSTQAKSDLENLLSIEMSIRLLDTANLILPQEPLPIPPPPPDYNFCTD
ncbi:Engulfment and cell motility protein 1 [Holothuria leucospilota]|uniref:Engulfment and cell motility protein 1 n=1 Tax=Holothuria leucospilota TaxID=206669 RepID=A0A9Q1HAQ4_HOLLE|nr:Engulfment and cell motility protein 1 [Holothuria leucospilota]